MVLGCSCWSLVVLGGLVVVGGWWWLVVGGGEEGGWGFVSGAGGICFTKPLRIFYPDKKGRFKVSWVPPTNIQNNVIIKNGVRYPGNDHIGSFGCDSYDISGTVDGQGSKGALHGLTKFSMEDAPANTFFLEYLARPQTAEMFFEDVLMALVFYGMPLLAENNKCQNNGLFEIEDKGNTTELQKDCSFWDCTPNSMEWICTQLLKP